MARRALTLREGRAPVWDRLLTMLFLAGLLHGLIIIGLTFNAAASSGNSAPGLEVLLVSDELPEADKNPTATYLAQRTQVGSGNTRKAVAPRNRTASIPTLKHAGTAHGHLAQRCGRGLGQDPGRAGLKLDRLEHQRALPRRGRGSRHRARPAAADRPAADGRAGAR